MSVRVRMRVCDVGLALPAELPSGLLGPSRGPVLSPTWCDPKQVSAVSEHHLLLWTLLGKGYRAPQGWREGSGAPPLVRGQARTPR